MNKAGQRGLSRSRLARTITRSTQSGTVQVLGDLGKIGGRRNKPNVAAIRYLYLSGRGIVNRIENVLRSGLSVFVSATTVNPSLSGLDCPSNEDTGPNGFSWAGIEDFF